MRKFFKWVVLPLFLLAVIVVGLCFVPAVQKAVATRVLAGYVDELQIKTLSAGLGSARIEGLSLSKDGAKVSLESAQVDYSLSGILFGKHVALSRVSVQKAVADLSQYRAVAAAEKPAEATTPAAPAEPAGPFDWTFALGELDADATVVLPEGKGTLVLKTSARGLGNAQTGTCAAAATFAGVADGKQMRSTFSIAAQIAMPEKTPVPTAVTLKGALSGAVGDLAAAIDMDVSVREQAAGVREFSATVAEGGAQLLSVKGTFDEPKGLLQSAFSVSVKPQQIAPFTGAMALPAVEMVSSGTVAFDLAKGEGTLALDADARAGDFGRVDARLSGLPKLRLKANADIAYAPKAVNVRALSADLYGDGAAAWASVALLQPFALDPKDPTAMAQLKGDLLKVQLAGIPAALAQSFAGDVKIAGGSLSGAVVLSAQESTLKASTSQPISLRGLSVLSQGKPLAQVSSADVNLNVLYKDGGVSFGYGAAVTLPAATTRAPTAALSAVGSGTYLVATQALAAKGEASCTFAALLGQGFLAEKLPDGFSLPYVFKAAFDMGYTPDAMTVNQAVLQCADGAKTPLSVKLLKPVSVATADLKNFEKMPLPQGDLLEVAVAAFDLRAANAFLPTGMVLGEGALSAKLGVSVKDKVCTVRASEPLALSGLSLSKDGERWVSRLGVSVNPLLSCDCAQMDMQLSLPDLRVVSSGLPTPAVSASAQVAVEKKALASAQLKMDADLPTLFNALPMLSTVNNVRKGRVQANAQLNKDSAFTASVVVGTLTANFGDHAGDSIPGLSATLSGRYATEPMAVNVSGPFVLLGPSGTTSMALQLAWKNGADAAQSLDLSVNGDTVHAADFMLVAAAFNPPTQSPEAAKVAQAAPTVYKPASTKADEKPFWAGFTGKVEAKLKKLTYDTFVLDNPVVAAQITKDALALSTLSAGLAGSPATASGTLIFQQGQRQPYRLAAQAGLSNLDIGKFLAKDGQKPVLEGKFSTAGGLSGVGANVAHLTENLQGSFSANSSEGTLYLLSSSNNQLAQTVGGLASVASTFLGGGNAKIPVLTPLLNVLSAMHYEKLSVKISRGADLNIVLGELLVKGNDAMIVGNGRIVHQAGVSLMDQPLEVQAQLFARSGIAGPLSGIGLFETKANAEGYFAGPVFPIRGSLSHVNTSILSDILSQSAKRVLTGSDTQTQQTTSPGTTTSSPSEGGRVIQNVLKGFLNQ